LRAQGDLSGARVLQEQLLAVRRRVLGEEQPDTLRSMMNLALTLHAQGDLPAARALQEQVLAVRRRVLGDEHPDTLVVMNDLAETLLSLGMLAEAQQLQKEALALQRKLLSRMADPSANAASHRSTFQSSSTARSEPGLRQLHGAQI
jgi:tetratricopeptide (TPR) repeat protein